MRFRPPRAFIDFETFSYVSLKDCGVFRYAEDPSTEALILAYAIGDGPVVGVDLSNPGNLLHPLFDAIDGGAIVCAHNVQFERTIWPLCRFPITPAEDQWDCTAARARMLAIPGALEKAAEAIGLQIKKDPRGTALINLFSKPQKGRRTFPKDMPEQFLEFIEYCKQDVEVERQLDELLPPLSDIEAEALRLDYKINNIGIPVNIDLVRKADQFVEEYSERLMNRAIEIAGCRPTQRDKTLAWLKAEGFELPNLQAATVEELGRSKVPPHIKELVDLRIELSRAGTKKFKAIQNTVSSDGRIRGGFLFSAASTRRWSSTGVQLHNLQKPEGETNPESVFELLASNPALLVDLFDRPLTAIAQSIRGFFESEDFFQIADYSSIEARGLAWLADEDWLVEAYRRKEDAYKITASRVYHIPTASITKDSIQRFLGKQLVLGCGYGMGPPRFVESCAKFGQVISLEESTEAVYGYRDSVPNIVKFWRSLEAACIKAVREWKTLRVGRLQFRPYTLVNGFKILFVDMPSGTIAYPKPRIGKEVWNGEPRATFNFFTPLGTHFIETDTFGGSLAENVTQALTRDILRDGMLAADKAGHKIVAHVHDEAIAEGSDNQDDLADFQRCLSQSSPWAVGLPIDTEGFISKRYKK